MLKSVIVAVLLTGLVLAAVAQQAPEYTYGNRPIDLLPKSQVPRPETETEWGDSAVTAPRLALHPKDLFRVGEAGLERLSVVEAAALRELSGTAAELALLEASGQACWRESAAWAGPTVRLRPYWLPVAGTAGRLVLREGAQVLAEAAAAPGEGAPEYLLEVQPAAETLAVDAGLALPSASDLLVLSGGALTVRLGGAAPLPPGLEACAVTAWGLAPLTAPLAPTARGRAAVGRLQLPPLSPGLRRLTIVVRAAGRQLLRRSYGLHVVAAPPPPVFGARSADLRFTSPVRDGDAERSWEELWGQSDKRDVVVTLPGRRARLVFWRGASYVPCWALPEAWLTYEWLEAEPYFFGADDCVEPLQDRECKYSSAHIVSSTPARVLVSWQYSLTDFQNRVVRGEHAEELFTIYPDGAGTRLLRAFYEDGWHENQEFIVVNRPGRRPAEALQPQAVTFYNLEGERQAPVWPKPGFSLDGWRQVVALVNMTAGPRPFMVTANAPQQVKVWAAPFLDKPDLFNSYPHWPVTRGLRTSWLSDPRDFRRPTHSNLVNLVNAAVRRQEGEQDFLWLIGVADEDATAVAAGACWVRPGEVRAGPGTTGGAYSADERAYVLQRGTGPACRFELVPAAGTAVLNPAFIIKGWQGAAQVRVGGVAATAVGQEPGQLVVWVRGRFTEPTAVEVSGGPRG